MILRWFIGLFMIGLLSPPWARDWALAAVPASQSYELEQIIDLTLERNPAMAGAEGFVEQHRGQQTAAGAYPNPTFQGNGGRGYIKDAGILTPRHSPVGDRVHLWPRPTT